MLNTSFFKKLEVGNALEEASSVHFVLYDDGLAKGTVRLLADLDDKTALIQLVCLKALDLL